MSKINRPSTLTLVASVRPSARPSHFPRVSLNTKCRSNEGLAHYNVTAMWRSQDRLPTDRRSLHGPCLPLAVHSYSKLSATVKHRMAATAAHCLSRAESNDRRVPLGDEPVHGSDRLRQLHLGSCGIMGYEITAFYNRGAPGGGGGGERCRGAAPKQNPKIIKKIL
jgi:hypothetical protein